MRRNDRGEREPEGTHRAPSATPGVHLQDSEWQTEATLCIHTINS